MMGFNAENTRLNEEAKDFMEQAMIPIDFTNAIAYGQTGSGKTTSYILPNLIKRIEEGHCVIVYDYKGTLSRQIIHIANLQGKLDNVIEFGVPWGERVNLLKDMSLKELESWNKYLNKDYRSYWDNSAFNLLKSILNALKLIKNFVEEKYIDERVIIGALFPDDEEIQEKIRKIHSLVREINTKLNFQYLNFFINSSQINTICEHLMTLSKCAGKLQEVEMQARHCKILYQYEKNTLACYVALREFINLKSADTGTGNKGVLEHLLNQLQELALNPFINDDTKTINRFIKKGKIIIIHHDSFSDESIRLVHERIFNVLKYKNTMRDKPVKTSFFIDEAHKILTPENLPEVSVCREFKLEYILAVQNENSLIEALGQKGFNSIKDNLSYQISFRNPNLDACCDLDDFEFVVLGTSRYYDKDRVRKIRPYFFDDKDCVKSLNAYFKLKFKDERYWLRKSSDWDIDFSDLSDMAYLKIHPTDKERAILKDEQKTFDIQIHDINYTRR